jgi:beta-lactamase regulating signal transducer with metallopeptidase domain
MTNVMIDAAFIIATAAKSLVVAGATLGVLQFTKKRSAAERSLIGHLGLVALVVLPAISLLIPGWNPLPVAAQDAATVFEAPLARAIPQASAAVAASAPTTGATAASAWTLPSAGQLAVWLYLLPLAILLLTMVVAVVRLGAMHRRANVLVNPSWQAALAMAQRRMGFKHGTALLVSEELRSPVSWGVMRPIILLNEQAVGAVDEAEAIIAHELAHVARLDWAKLLISRTACALFWFNPLVWRLARECHQLREEAADDAVLLSEVDGADYASLLVNAARHDNKALLIAAHGVAPGKDSLKRRITRVLDADLARGPANNGWAALCVIALVVVAAPLAAFDPTAKGSGISSSANGTVVLNGPEGTLRVRPDGSVLLTSPDGKTLTVKHFPTGQETLTTGATAALGDDSDRDRDSDDEEIDAIIASKAVGLTPDYIAAMRAAGFGGSVDDLTGARAVGVTPEYARQMRQYDPNIDLDTVIGAKATGLSPEYFTQMRQMFPGLSLDDAVGMNAVGVTLDFARQMRSLFPRATADDIQSMRAVGVTPEYVREMRRNGLSAGDPDEVIESRVVFPRNKGKTARAGQPVHTALAASITNSVSAGLKAVDKVRIELTPPAAPAAPVPPVAPDPDDD